MLKKPLKPIYAIILAVLAMWLIGVIGVFVLVHCGDISFFFPPKNDKYTNLSIAWVLLFYMSYLAARLPAAFAGGSVIALSRFKYPIIVSFLVSFIFHTALLGSRMIFAGHSWDEYTNLTGISPNIPVYAELSSVFLLACASVVMTWFTIGPIGKYLMETNKGNLKKRLPTICTVLILFTIILIAIAHIIVTILKWAVGI